MTRPNDTSHASARRADAGFTIIELLVTVAIMLVVTGAIFALIDPNRNIFRTQPEVSDMQQRMRVATDQISKDLIMAGAGTYSGDSAGPAGALANFFAPILPVRMGTLYPTEPAQRYFPDRITIAYVPTTAAQTKVVDPMPQPSSEVKVGRQPGCPDEDDLCGFEEGMRVLIFDDTGTFDFFTITAVQRASLHLQHAPPTNPDDFSKKYLPIENARVAQVETHTYFRDTATNQLMHYWGDSRPPEPVVDNVVAMSFRYYGDPTPPLAPKPELGKSNCIFDATGNSTLPTLPSTGSLVELDEALFKNGALCGQPPNQFDADLYRVRKVRVLLRIQTPLPELRGSDPFNFRNPGRSDSGQRRVPDFEMTFEIAPRNMNLTR